MREGPRNPLEMMNLLDESIACFPRHFFLINAARLTLPTNVNAMQRE